MYRAITIVLLSGVASGVRDRRIVCSWRVWQQLVQQTDEIWDVIVSGPSEVTPKLDAVETMPIMYDDTVVNKGS